MADFIFNCYYKDIYEWNKADALKLIKILLIILSLIVNIFYIRFYINNYKNS